MPSLGLQDQNRGLYLLGGKRLMDVLFAFLGLNLLAPIFLVVAAVIKLTSPGPVFYLQDRVGRDARLFKIVKFRSMVAGTDGNGPGITVSGDPRVTKAGLFLRRFKIDELPQLWNVLVGDMSLVGPRPELPTYVATYTPQQRSVLAVRPGITDIGSLAYSQEEQVLRVSPNPEQLYREEILPRKLALNLEYIEKMSLTFDLVLILRTLRALLPSFHFQKAR